MQAKSAISAVNAHVQEYLDYYCDLTSSPGFAVLLKGAWGSGKTWFIEQYQRRLVAKNIRTLYVSLYGMKSTTEIEDKFFQLLHPIRSSRGMAVTGIILKGLLKGALKIDLTGDGNDDGTWNIQIPNIDLPQKLDDIDKSILIFDDLDRCKIDLGSLLGYINFFVEHNDMKVIMIADEEKLLGDKDYASIKEKLIGKTLSVLPSFEDAIDSFLGKVEDTALEAFLSGNFGTIKDLYKIVDYNNLRSLNHICLEFSRIFQALPEKVKSNTEALNDILRTLSAFSIEIQQGRLLTKNIDQLQEEYDSHLRNDINSKFIRSPNKRDGSEVSKETEPRFEIFEKFPFLGGYTVFPSYFWWKKLFDQGAIDLAELNESISSSKYFQDENTPNWIRLWHFLELSDEDFEKLIKMIEQEHEDRISSEIGAITHVVGLFLVFSEAGIYKRSKKDILSASISYIDDLRRADRLEPWTFHITLPEAIGSMIGGGYRSLAFQGKEIEEFKEFCKHLRKSRKEVYFEKMPQKAQDLLEIMGDDIFRFHQIICLDSPSGKDGDLRYQEVPILNYIETNLFVEKILSIKSEDAQYLFWALSERYKYDNINEKLVEELEWLKSIQKLLAKEVSLRKGKLSGYCLNLLNRDYLSGAIEKLSSKKSDK